MADCATNLTEAKAALHKLIIAKSTGEQVIESTVNGRSTKYYVNANGEKELRRYIAELERECGTRRRRSIGFHG